MSGRADSGHGAAAGTNPDAALVAALHEPGSEALAALFRRYARLVYRVAVGILHDEAEAEDVVQDVFLEIYCKAHQYDPSRGAVRVWLLQYAYHRSLRRKDSLRRRVAYGGESLDDIDRLADRYRERLTREECRWVIHTGLAQLSPPQRATLELTYLEDLSLRDVADRLRVSLGCARHYYYRGLTRLRAWAQLAGALAPATEGRGDLRRDATDRWQTADGDMAAITRRETSTRKPARTPAPRRSRPCPTRSAPEAPRARARRDGRAPD